MNIAGTVRGRGGSLTALAVVLTLAGCATKTAPIAPRPPAPVAAVPQIQPPAAPKSISLNRRQKISNILISLNNGEVATARVGVVAMLAEQPDDPVATDLLRQIDTDPKLLLGEASYPYQIRQRETLSMIAGRLLGSPYRFWALARYNGIAVPNSAGAGRVIQIPGVAPVRAVTVKPDPVKPKAAPVANAVPERPAARVDTAAAARLRRAGLDEMARGSIDKAVPLLERALAANPGDATIQADLARARKVQQAVRQN